LAELTEEDIGRYAGKEGAHVAHPGAAVQVVERASFRHLPESAAEVDPARIDREPVARGGDAGHAHAGGGVPQRPRVGPSQLLREAAPHAPEPHQREAHVPAHASARLPTPPGLESG
jgi:hypothetical protein